MSRINYSQDHLLNQAADFLQYQAENDPSYLGPPESKHYAHTKEYHQETVFKIRNSVGECVGIMLVKIYALLISRNLPKKLLWKPHDHTWVKTARTDLSLWHPNQDEKYSASQKTAMIEYLQQILYMQHSLKFISNEDFTYVDRFSVLSSKPSQSLQLNCIGGCIGFFSQAELSRLLSRFLANDVDRFLILTSHNHTGLITLNETDQKKINFFNASDKNDELVFNNFSEATHYFATGYPELKPDIRNPTFIIVLKDAAKTESNYCPSLEEVADLCEGGEIHSSAETPDHVGGLTVQHLFIHNNDEFPYDEASYRQYFHNKFIEKNDENIALMMGAAAEDDLDSLETIKESKFDFNIQDHQERTMLITATIGEHRNFVNKLIAMKVNLNLQDRHGFTALTYASLQDSPALTYASLQDSPTLCSLLLRSGADAEIPDDNGWTPLFHAVHNRKTANVAALLQTNLNLFTLDIADKTVLDYAIDSHHTEIIDLLLAHRYLGVPPLVRAASDNNLGVLEKLLALGVDIEEMDTDNMTALIVATGLGQLDMLPVLLQAGADPLWKDNFGKNALTYAVEQKNHAAQAILANCDYHGMPILSWAVSRGNVALTRQLIAAGAELDRQDHDSDTALMTAVAVGNKALIIILVATGANLTIKNVHGKTARDYAAESLSPEMVALLTPRPSKTITELPHLWGNRRAAIPRGSSDLNSSCLHR